MVWTAWTLDRIVIFLMGFAYLLIFAQVTMFHYRQNFRHYAMWFPVVEGPIIGTAAILASLTSSQSLVTITTVLFGLGAVSGVLGFVYHFVGVGERVEGYVLRNFLVGPPVILPLTFSALGLVGLFAIYWR